MENTSANRLTAEGCKFGDGKVFLGGSCNPTTWRQDYAMPTLEKAGVGFFNPQIDDWSNEWATEVEIPAKKEAGAFLFVIDAETRAVASLVEAAGYVASGAEIYLVVNDMVDNTDIRGQVVTGRELGDLNRGREYLRLLAEEHNVPLYANVEEAVNAIIAKYGNR